MPDDQFNALAEFRKRYPSAKLSDQEVYRGLANPDNFRSAFPEYAHVDNTTIGRNVAAEAGKVTDTGKPWYKQAWEDVEAIGSQAKENIMTGGKSGQMATLNANKQLAADAAARKAEGRSLPYRIAANTAESSGLFNPRPMEEAANAGHPGEVVGHAVAAAVPYAVPLAVEGVVGAGRAVRNAAMEEPVVARQRAFNVAPKSKQAIRAQKEGTNAAPYLKGSKNLADVQARIPAAKQEIFQPYMDAVAAHDATGQTLTAPDGSPVTAAKLEELRQQTSAQLQSTRKMQPTEQWTAVQKGQQIADLTEQYRKITSELDPAISNQGINPKKTRATFGAVKGVEKRFEGRSTLLENKPSGVQKMAGVDITKPETLVGAPASGARDIAAGRGWWSQKPTDVQVREGFRTAGPKPDLTTPGRQPPAGLLPPAPLVTPPPGPTPPNLTPPAVAPTSRAQRLGLILPEQSVSSARPQIPTNYTEPAAAGAVNYGEQPPAAPVTATEQPSSVKANRRVVRDPKTGKMKIQYLTSGGGEIIRDVPPSKMSSGGEEDAALQLSRKMAAAESQGTEKPNSRVKTKREQYMDFLDRGQRPAPPGTTATDTPENRFSYKGKKAWSGIADLRDGSIDEVHDYQTAERADFHHSFYTSPEAQLKMREGDATFFTIDKNGKMHDGRGDNLPPKIEKAIRAQMDKPETKEISITDIRRAGEEARKANKPVKDSLSDYQKRVEEGLKGAGISPEKINRKVAGQSLPDEERPAQKPTGSSLADVQREVNGLGMSDVVTPTEARKLSIELAKSEYKNMTPLMKRRFIERHLTYGGK